MNHENKTDSEQLQQTRDHPEDCTEQQQKHESPHANTIESDVSVYPRGREYDLWQREEQKNDGRKRYFESNDQNQDAYEQENQEMEQGVHEVMCVYQLTRERQNEDWIERTPYHHLNS